MAETEVVQLGVGETNPVQERDWLRARLAHALSMLDTVVQLWTLGDRHNFQLFMEDIESFLAGVDLPMQLADGAYDAGLMAGKVKADEQWIEAIGIVLDRRPSPMIRDAFFEVMDEAIGDAAASRGETGGDTR